MNITNRKVFGDMEIFLTKVNGVKVLCPKVFGDNRGSFMELWNEKVMKQNGLDDNFIQDNISTSVKGVLRGVHTQLKFPQAKIVSCLKGMIFDVAVDCRKDSTTFGKWYGELLSAENCRQMYLPEGVAHGFLTLEDAMVHMKVTTHYTPGDEIGFTWNDPKIGISWPIPVGMDLIFADKDLQWGNFDDLVEKVNSFR